MKFKANDTSTQNSPASSQVASSQAASPSVPISVYRELAAELQATRAMVNSLNAKNQELTLQNQKLRQEIHRFAQSAIALKSLVDPTHASVRSFNAVDHAVTDAKLSPGKLGKPPYSEATFTTEETAAASAIAARLRPPEPTSSFEELFTEEPAQTPSKLERQPKELGGLWLTLTIVLIMVTAFGAGFLVVRPLLPTSK